MTWREIRWREVFHARFLSGASRSPYRATGATVVATPNLTVPLHFATFVAFLVWKQFTVLRNLSRRIQQKFEGHFCSSRSAPIMVSSRILCAKATLLSFISRNKLNSAAAPPPPPRENKRSEVALPAKNFAKSCFTKQKLSEKNC